MFQFVLRWLQEDVCNNIMEMVLSCLYLTIEIHRSMSFVCHTSSAASGSQTEKWLVDRSSSSASDDDVFMTCPLAGEGKRREPGEGSGGEERDVCLRFVGGKLWHRDLELEHTRQKHQIKSVVEGKCVSLLSFVWKTNDGGIQICCCESVGRGLVPWGWFGFTQKSWLPCCTAVSAASAC